MAAGNTAKLTLQLVDQVTGPASRIAGALRGVNNSMATIANVSMAPSRALQSAARGVERVAHTAAPAGAALAVGVAAGGRAAYESELALNRAMAAANLTMVERQRIEANALKLNLQYGGSVNDVIGAHAEVLKSGVDLEKSFLLLPHALDLAQHTGESPLDTVRALTTSVIALGLEMERSGEVADRFSQMLDRTSGISQSDFEISGKYANPALHAVGLSPDEIAALQIELAKGGIYGSSAGTGLRAAPAAILAPTDKAMGAFNRLDLDPAMFRGDRTGEVTAAQILGTLEARGAQTEGLEAAIADIVASRADDAEKIRAIVSQLGDSLGAVTGEDLAELTQSLTLAFASGSRRADVPALLRTLKEVNAGFADYEALFGRNHASKMMGFDPKVFDEELELLRTEARGSTSRKSAMVMQGIVGDANEAEGAIQGLIAAVKNSGALSDAARAMIAFSDGVTRLAETNPKILRFAFAAAAATAASVPLAFAISSVAAVAGVALSPITLVGTALAGLVALNWEPLSNSAQTFAWNLQRAIDPAIVERIRSTADAVRDFAGGLQLSDLGLNRVGAIMGSGLADGVNAAWASLPRLGEIASSIAAVRIDPLRDLVGAIVDFGQRAAPYLTPAVAEAVSLVGASFTTLANGATAVGRLLGGATEAFVGFNKGLYGALSGDALGSTGNGIAVALETIAAPVRALGELFNTIDLDIGAFAQNAGAKVGVGISAIVTAFANAPAAIGAAFDGVKAKFDAIAAYTPSFGGILSAVMSFAESIGSAAQRVADAVTSMLNAISRLSVGAAGALVGGPGISTMPAPVSPGAAIGAIGGASFPRKAAGGAIRRGLYTVGERGPEVVAMGGNGYVTPNHRLGGGGDTFNVTINNPQGDGSRIADDVMFRIEQRWSRKLSRSGQIAINR